MEVEVKKGEIRNCFPMVVSYCCNTSEAKSTSTVRHGAGKRNFCVRCRSTHEDRVRVRKRSSRLVAETIETRKEGVGKQVEAASWDGRGLTTGRRETWSRPAAFAVPAVSAGVAVFFCRQVRRR